MKSSINIYQKVTLEGEFVKTTMTPDLTARTERLNFPQQTPKEAIMPIIEQFSHEEQFRLIESLLASRKAIEFNETKATIVVWHDQHIVRATEVEPAEETGIHLPQIQILSGVKLPKRPGLSFLLGLFALNDYFLEARIPNEIHRCCRVRSDDLRNLITVA